MRNNIMTILCLITLSVFNTRAQNCPNGGLEDGDFSNWEFYSAVGQGPINGFANLANFTQITNPIPDMPPNAFLESNGSDYSVPSINKTVSGNNSLRINEPSPGADGTIASYTVTIDANMKISFSYAIVMQDPSHEESEKPFFAYWVSRSNTLANSLSPTNEVHKKKWISNDQWFQSSNAFKYKDWQQECYDLNKFNEENEENPILPGEQLTLYFYVQDCSQHGHEAYAYIDAICEDIVIPEFTLNNSTICSWDNLIADGSATVNEKLYFWSIEDIGNPNGFPVQTMGDLTIGNVGLFNIGQWVDNLSSYTKNRFFTDASTFRIHLHVLACSGEWISYTQDVIVDLPNLEAESEFYCCEEKTLNNQLTAVVNLDPGDATNGIFTWYNENDQPIGTGSTNPITVGGQIVTLINTISVGPMTNSSEKYRVEYIDLNNCKNSKYVYRLRVGEPDVVLKREECYKSDVKPCGLRKIKAFPSFNKCEGDEWAERNPSEWLITIMDHFGGYALNGATYQWNTGATTQEINMIDGITNYECTITLDPDLLPCPIDGGNTLTKDIDIDFSWYEGNFPQLNYTTGITMTQCFAVFHILPNPGERIYNAFGYKLQVWNRWGQRIYMTAGNKRNFSNFDDNYFYKLCNSFNNGDIRLCLKPNAQSIVDPGVLQFVLDLENCDGQSQRIRGNMTVIY